MMVPLNLTMALVIREPSKRPSALMTERYRIRERLDQQLNLYVFCDYGKRPQLPGCFEWLLGYCCVVAIMLFLYCTVVPRLIKVVFLNADFSFLMLQYVTFASLWPSLIDPTS